MALHPKLCVVESASENLRVRVAEGYSWVSVDPKTGEQTDGSLFWDEVELFKHFEPIVGFALPSAPPGTSQLDSPSLTPTPAPLSPSPSSTSMPAHTPTPEPAITVTFAPTATASRSPSPTEIPTHTSTSTPSPTSTPPPSATPSPPPSPTPTLTSTPTPGRPDVQIACVFFDGQAESTESDEYVEVANLGSAAQDMAGWRLADIADDGPEFVFPPKLLEPGQVIRVYTNEAHPEWGGFSFGRGSAIWSNSIPDEAGLFNDAGELVSAKGYPPGC